VRKAASPADFLADPIGAYFAGRSFVAWMHSPATVILMVLLIAMLFHHTALGLKMIVEDYVHSELKFAALAMLRLGCFAVAAAGIVATLLTAFGR
jgi:succinate dehydrogenase / fumarate reductase membrane anchor subunit